MGKIILIEKQALGKTLRLFKITLRRQYCERQVATSMFVLEKTWKHAHQHENNIPKIFVCISFY